MSVYQQLDERIRGFIGEQRMFFVATAPLSAEGHVNLSPKGLDTFRVIDGHTVAYLDYVGSGVETIAHLRENGRIVIMLCAFQGPPKILRLHGRGDVLEPDSADYAALRPRFPDTPSGRAIVRVRVDRITDSCGFGVPRYVFDADRTQLPAWAAHKGEDGLADYQREKNAKSLDGLKTLHWLDR
jgi:hypothetical protein